MAQIVEKFQTEIQDLSSNLLSTLDEAVFFNQLCKFFVNKVEADRICIFKVLEDSSAVMLSRDGEVIDNGLKLEKGVGAAGHVIRTKKSYFSNSVERDPIFHKIIGDGVKAELCVPVVIDGFVIGTIHFQTMNEERKFQRDDITEIVSVLEGLDKPLKNMKMFLSAKYLNESLLRKVEQKEKELAESKAGVQVGQTYKIEEQEIIGKSEAMKLVLNLAEKVAGSDVFALVQGETGSGKEMIARRVHCRSARKEAAFISVDCSSLTEAQLEIELFGEEGGDFTRGPRVRNGMIEQANNGTLFLNNIEAMPASIQSKLMNFLNEKMAFRVAGQVPFRSDIRIIAATSKDLRESVEKTEFREDLFYAVNVMNLKVPSLRERREDIELLASFFLNKGKLAEDQKSLSPGVIKSLLEYNWPGNVRELQSIMERAYILSDGMIIERDHLAESVSNVEPVVEETQSETYSFTEMTLDALEKKHICNTLEHLGGNKTKTAKTLGITVKTLYNKLHSYGMIAPKEA